MIHPMPVAKEIVEAHQRIHLDMAILLRNLSSRDSAVVQESSEVLSEVGELSVPFLVHSLNNTNNRDLSFRIIDILDKIGPRAWQQALPRLYHKLRDNNNPEVCQRISQAFRSLQPYRPSAPPTGNPGHWEQLPQPGTPPEHAVSPSTEGGSGNAGRTPTSLTKSRHRVKKPRTQRPSAESSSIPPE